MADAPIGSTVNKSSMVFVAADNALQNVAFSAAFYYVNPFIEHIAKKWFPDSPKEKDEDTGLMRTPPNFAREAFETFFMTLFFSGMMKLMHFESIVMTYIFEFIKVAFILLGKALKYLYNGFMDLVKGSKRAGVLGLEKVKRLENQKDDTKQWYTIVQDYCSNWLSARKAQYDALRLHQATTEEEIKMQNKAELNVQMASLQTEQFIHMFNYKVMIGKVTERDWEQYMMILEKSNPLDQTTVNELRTLSMAQINSICKKDFTVIGEHTYSQGELIQMLLSALNYTIVPSPTNSNTTQPKVA